MTYVDAQHLLAFLKFYRGNCDGIWGPQSKKAMSEFQTRFGGLEPNGQLNEDSGKALRHAVAYMYDEVEVEPDAPTDEVYWDAVPHFTKEELACKCKRYNGPYCDGFPYKIQPLLVDILERCRDHFGTPIVVVSGLRCKQHNADSGGVSNSQHMYGEACDICVYGKNPETVLKWFQSQSDVRYAYRIADSDNIHFDIQPVGR
jgi:hypothetical protein